MSMNFIIIFFTPLFLALFSQKTHILNFLIILEIMLLSIMFFAMLLMFSISLMNSFLLIIILSFAVCEASVALACLVSLSRHKNTLLMPSLSLIKC